MASTSETPNRTLVDSFNISLNEFLNERLSSHAMLCQAMPSHAMSEHLNEPDSKPVTRALNQARKPQRSQRVIQFVLPAQNRRHFVSIQTLV